MEQLIPTTDGVRLYARHAGNGEGTPIVCCNGLGVSTFFWKYIVEGFSPSRRVVTWDYRGHGRSEPPDDPADATISCFVQDLRQVLDALEIDRALLVGHSMGCQIILEAYRQYPERIAGLSPMLGTHGRAIDTFFGMPRVSRNLFRAALLLATTLPGASNRVVKRLIRSRATWPLTRLSGIVHRNLCTIEDLGPYLKHLARVDVEMFMRLAESMQEHTTEDILETIRVPTLIVAGERDLFTPLRQSEEMAERIPKAELLKIPLGSHAALVEQPELINLRLEKFLRERVDGQRAEAASAA